MELCWFLSGLNKRNERGSDLHCSRNKEWSESVRTFQRHHFLSNIYPYQCIHSQVSNWAGSKTTKQATVWSSKRQIEIQIGTEASYREKACGPYPASVKCSIMAIEPPTKLESGMSQWLASFFAFIGFAVHGPDFIVSISMTERNKDISRDWTSIFWHTTKDTIFQLNPYAQ